MYVGVCVCMCVRIQGYVCACVCFREGDDQSDVAIEVSVRTAHMSGENTILTAHNRHTIVTQSSHNTHLMDAEDASRVATVRTDLLAEACAVAGIPVEGKREGGE